jgi:hypothetical protein
MEVTMFSRSLSAALGLVVTLVAAAAVAGDGVELKYRFAKGDKLVMRTKSEVKQTQTIMGQTIENTIDNEAISTVTVEDVDEKGNFHLGLKGERLKVKMKFGPLGDYVFDSQSSERDKSSMLGGALTPLYERISGAMFQATIKPDGEILAVKGYADQIRDLLEGNPLTAQFANGGTDEAAKLGLEQQFPRISGKAAKPGDTWDRPYEIELAKIGKVKGKSMYRYLGPDKVGDKETAKIEVMSEGSIDINVEMMGVKVTGSLNVTNGSSTIQFDPVAGRIVLHEDTVVMAGDLNVDANGMNIPIRQEQTMKSKVEYLDKIPD